jgi:predicted RNase H-like nuclease (RuvC/YqgF family)
MADYSRDDIIRAAVRIEHLRAEISSLQRELQEAERKLDLLIGKSTITNGRARLSLNDQIVGLLETYQSRQFKIEDVIKHLPDAKEDSIRTALPKLAKLGRIRKSGWGMYESTGSDVGEVVDTGEEDE